MTESIAFRTRARTIDHLGREQIADVPTAISELWKNAYDAYASRVATYLYADAQPYAAIYDDGHGMSRADFVDKWLVVGTDSKVAATTPAHLRRGMAERPRQGQKGIGRLSVAALGASVLILSKTDNSKFVASLLDWRVFENPFLLLHDIRVPVAEFDEQKELQGLLPELKRQLLDNVAPELSDKEKKSEEDLRKERIVLAWSMFDELETTNLGSVETTSGRIRSILDASLLDLPQLDDWAVWTGKDSSGTAMIVSELNNFLLSLIEARGPNSSDASESVRVSLTRALSGFSDPYVDTEDAIDYRFVVHAYEAERNLVQREEQFGIDFLRSLEHFFEGTVDSLGVFRGTVKAFGKHLGDVEFLPSEPPPVSPREFVGPLKICIGTFEQDRKFSTASDELHAMWSSRADSHSGLTIYRDGLRVMPYGRPENDFFQIEERRGRHAGREFWASRRLFGRIAITRSQNPNLRDKAGREGLIDNTASRALQTLIIDLLKGLARRYYGTDSPVRQEFLPAIEAENIEAADKARSAKKRTLRSFQAALKTNLVRIEEAISAIRQLEEELEAAIQEQDAAALYKLTDRIDDIDTLRLDLKLPPRPKSLGSAESRYRLYRDIYSRFASDTMEVRRKFVEQCDLLQAVSPMEAARSQLGRSQKAVIDRLGGWKRDIEKILRTEISRIDSQISDDNKEFYRMAAPLLVELESGSMSLSRVLTEMDVIKESLIARFSSVYDPYLRAVDQLSSGIDLDSALSYAEARQSTLETRLARIQSLAQIGISVEILSHELQSLNRRLARSLEKLPEDVLKSKAFKSADEVRRELVERLRFLSQLQVTEGDIRKRITGEEIENYLHTFFSRLLEEKFVTLEASEDFRKASFYEYPSRIYPVFINLINNAIYWLEGAEQHRILLEARDGTLLIADTGPGVDPDDEESLFELFFTRRLRGRGVGLYLSRQTLAAGGHTIRYISSAEERILKGANFEIKLRDGFDA